MGNRGKDPRGNMADGTTTIFTSHGDLVTAEKGVEPWRPGAEGSAKKGPRTKRIQNDKKKNTFPTGRRQPGNKP